MSDCSQGEGWWLASDAKWYPPEQSPFYQSAPGAFPTTDTSSQMLQTPYQPAQPTESASPWNQNPLGQNSQKWMGAKSTRGRFNSSQLRSRPALIALVGLAIVLVIGIIYSVFLSSSSNFTTALYSSGNARFQVAFPSKPVVDSNPSGSLGSSGQGDHTTAFVTGNDMIKSLNSNSNNIPQPPGFAVVQNVAPSLSQVSSDMKQIESAPGMVKTAVGNTVGYENVSLEGTSILVEGGATQTNPNAYIGILWVASNRLEYGIIAISTHESQVKDFLNSFRIVG